MPSSTLRWRWLLLAGLPCLALRCMPYCDKCEPDCMAQPQGGLSLRPASLAWLPAPAPDSLRFRNSNGFRAVLALVTTPAAPDSVTLPARLNANVGYYEGSLNPEYKSCEPYFRARRVYRHYRGASLNLDLQFNLFKDLRSSPATGQQTLTRAAADTLPDILGVSFNEQYYAEFPVGRAPYRQPRTTPQGGLAVYLDTVQLAGRTFRGVYQYVRPGYSGAVQPQRFYFQPGLGLVGFTYTNNEQWARY